VAEPRHAGRGALVTGGTAGIGLAVARRLVADGARVVVVGRDRERGALAEAELGAAATFLAGDVADADRVVAAVLERLGRLDLLVSNAGFTIGRRALADIGDDDWDELEATNLRGAFAMVRAASRPMVEQRSGAIVAISSIAARGARLASNAAYATMKAGVVALVRATCVELGAAGVRINCVCPGPTRTEALDDLVARAAERDGVTIAEAERRIVESYAPALGRLVEGHDVAAVVSFLASEDAAAITGQTLNVDGGIALD